MKSKNMFVLLHGAGLGSWIWEDVIDNLQLPALAIDLPGRNTEADFRQMQIGNFVDAVVQAIESQHYEGKAILVAHSLTGALALAVHNKRPDLIDSIVFTGAAVPRSGQSYADCLPALPRLMLKIFARFYPAGLKAPEKVAQKVLCNDLDESAGVNVAKGMVPEAPCLFLDKVHWSGFVDALYVQLTNDKTDLSPALQEQMAAVIQDCSLVKMNCGHLPMISHPEELAAILNEYARRRGPNGP